MTWNCRLTSWLPAGACRSVKYICCKQEKVWSVLMFGWCEVCSYMPSNCSAFNYSAVLSLKERILSVYLLHFFAITSKEHLIRSNCSHLHCHICNFLPPISWDLRKVIRAQPTRKVQKSLLRRGGSLHFWRFECWTIFWNETRFYHLLPFQSTVPYPRLKAFAVGGEGTEINAFLWHLMRRIFYQQP